MYCLAPDTLRNIQSVFEGFTEVDEVWLYGSRAMGRERKGSDIDLTLFGKDLNIKILHRIQDALDGLCTPYEFDVSIFKDIDAMDVILHINRVGKVFYKRDAVREGWKTVKLGDVCKKGSSNVSKKDLHDDEGRFPISDFLILCSVSFVVL
jgi:predicted nucleotidyltransferase